MSDAGSRIQPVQVKDQVYELLRKALTDLEFAPGEPLREVALSAKYGVSKTPIREALVRLEQDGLVEITAYRGARASTYTREYLEKIHEAREILESECVRRAATSDGPATAKRLRKTIAQARVAVESGKLLAAAKHLDDFDEVLFDHLRNPLLEEVQQRLHTHIRRAARANITAETINKSLAEHEAVAEGVDNSDAVSAEQSLKAHLRSVRDQQISALELESA